MEQLWAKLTMARTGCAVPKPILVLVILATLCLMSEKLRIIYSQCGQNANRPLVALMGDNNNTLHNIAHYPVSHSKRGLRLYVYSAFLDARFSRDIIRIYGLEHREGTGETFRCKWSFYDKESDVWIVQEVPAKR